METNVRQWGNSAGVILPAPALAQAGIKLGDALEVVAQAGQIIIKTPSPVYTLDELLAASPDSAVILREEDKAWLNSPPVGREDI